MGFGSIISQAELWTRTALLVENDDAVAHLLQFMLQGEGYKVRRVADADAARAFAEQELPPDLVVLDVDFMPREGTGMDVLGTMRKAPEWRHVPVLVLGSAPHDSARMDATRGGTIAYAEKPLRAEDVRACVSRLINQSAVYTVHRRAGLNLPRHRRRY